MRTQLDGYIDGLLGRACVSGGSRQYLRGYLNGKKDRINFNITLKA